MNQGKYVFAQFFDILPKYEFDKCVVRYQGNFKVKGFTCWLQFLSMSFGQLTKRESLLDTVSYLAVHQKKFYHLVTVLRFRVRLWRKLTKIGIGVFLPILHKFYSFAPDSFIWTMTLDSTLKRRFMR